MLRGPVKKPTPAEAQNAFAVVLLDAANAKGIRGPIGLARLLGVRVRDVEAVNRGKVPPPGTARLWARMLGANEEAFAKASAEVRGGR